MSSGLEAALLCSAMALVSLSLQSRRLTAVPPANGTCRVHDGFCLAVERLVACLEHVDARVVEAAMLTLWRPRMRRALRWSMAWRLASVTEGVLVVGEADGVLLLGEADAVQRRAVWTVPAGGGDDSAEEVSSIRDGGRRRWQIYMNCLPEQHSLAPHVTSRIFLECYKVEKCEFQNFSWQCCKYQPK